MKHFNISQWSDFARGVADADLGAAMEAHLASGCRRCEPVVKVLREVALMARAEAEYDPPEDAVRCARAIFAMHQPEKVRFPRMIARLVHDSIRSPLPAGMRSQDRLSRHALYEAGTYYLDLQVERQRRGGLITLIGQLADRSRPAASTANVPVRLTERQRLIASTHCNRLGEFHLEYAPASNLTLQVSVPAARKRLVVSLNQLTPPAADSAASPKTARRQLSRAPRER
jgi:hypothetical protein